MHEPISSTTWHVFGAVQIIERHANGSPRAVTKPIKQLSIRITPAESIIHLRVKICKCKPSTIVLPFENSFIAMLSLICFCKSWPLLCDIFYILVFVFLCFRWGATRVRVAKSGVYMVCHTKLQIDSSAYNGIKEGEIYLEGCISFFSYAPL